MYELVILGQLSSGPKHGYGMAKVIDKIIGPFRRVQWGTLYPVLNRLEAEGLIQAEGEEEGDGGRARRIFSITEAGRRRLRDLLLDTGKHLGEYDLRFAHKVALFHHLTPEERLYLSRHYAVYAQQNIDHLEHHRLRLLNEPPPHLQGGGLEGIVQVIEHRILYWQAERGFAEDLISQCTTEEVIHGGR